MKEESGPMPTRSMNFRFEVDASNGRNFAAQFAEAVFANEKVKLDYSVKSLEFIDQFLQNFRDAGLTVNDFAETIFIAGCYVGEVMVKNAQGKWMNVKDIELPKGVMMLPIVVELANGNITDPVAKAFKRFYKGPEESIVTFYETFTKE